MPHDFRQLPLIEVEAIAERALHGGASEAYTIKYLMDGGIEENRARTIVAEKTAKRMQEIESIEEERRAEVRRRASTGALLAAFGTIVIIVSLLLPQPEPVYPLTGLGALFLIFGLRRVAYVYLQDS
jgi:hypothetical protein